MWRALNITANNDSSRDNEQVFMFQHRKYYGNYFKYSSRKDNFYNRGNITATNFTTSAKSVFFLNKEIDSFVIAHTMEEIFLLTGILVLEPLVV